MELDEEKNKKSNYLFHINKYNTWSTRFIWYFTQFVINILQLNLKTKFFINKCFYFIFCLRILIKNKTKSFIRPKRRDSRFKDIFWNIILSRLNVNIELFMLISFGIFTKLQFNFISNDCEISFISTLLAFNWLNAKYIT
jgi:hypothetical protein